MTRPPHSQLLTRLIELERFRSMADLSNDPMLIVDAESGLVVDANASAHQSFDGEAPTPPLLGRSFLGMLDPIARQRFEELMGAGKKTVQRLVLESTLPGRQGRYPAEIAVACGQYRQTLPNNAVVSIRDISVRKQTEAQLREADRELRLALKAANLGIWWDEGGTGLMRLDERAQAMFGAAEPFLPFSDLLGRVHPDDVSAVDATKAIGLDPTCSPGSLSHEYRILGDDGKYRWVEVHAHIEFQGRDESRRPVKVVGTVEDITARKRTKAQLTRLSLAYETLNEINKCVARSGSEDELLEQTCRIAVEHAGLRLVFVAALADGGVSACYAPDLGERKAWDTGLDAGQRRDMAAVLQARGRYGPVSLPPDDLLAPWAPLFARCSTGTLCLFPLTSAGRVTHAMGFCAAGDDDFDDETVGLLGEMAADISYGLGRLEEARRVRAVESRFATVFRFSPGSTLIISLADNRITDANERFLETFDYAASDVIGRSTLEAKLWQESSDRDTLFRLLARGRVDGFAASWRRRTGEVRDCLISAEILDFGGERQLICVATDVTDQKRAERLLHAREQEFRALVENSPDTIVRFDRNGRRTYANPEMVRALGARTEDVLGKTPLETLPPEMAQLVQSTLNRVIETATETELETTDPPVPGTRQVHRHIRFVPEFGVEGQVESVLVIGRDISRVKESELRLTETQEQLRKLGTRREAAREDERKRMARDIHDVLGQHLSALRLDVDMLGLEFGQEQPLLMERTAKTLQLIDNTIAIVRDLASALRPSALDMGIVLALEWQAREFGNRTGIRCKVLAKEDEIALNERQSVAVFRLVQESLTNVLRHAQARRVDISLARTGDKGYRLAIADDGAGFDPASVRKDALGLVGMRERALVLGGSLEIDSSPGNGTIISVDFPLQAADPAP